MRAREWVLAHRFGDPADHGIPELPAWTVYRDDCGGIALADEGAPFIAAERPVDVRR
ncbi:hypothetical protein [Natronomonas marina]|jgi:hypothetical protein|uniref:hypothetical protein n=1 Tax=Natronomonas marina TaxID=2961939 RepID=UPI0020C9576E|nr:hypothetical protein [Natronomonas marina]